MRIARLAGTLCMVAVACEPGMAWAQASAVGATVASRRTSRRPRRAARRGQGGEREWKCSTTHCSGRGPGGDATASCKALVAQVGALKSFTAEGRAVDVKTCGGSAIAAPAMQAAPVKKLTLVSTATPTPAAARRRRARHRPRQRQRRSWRRRVAASPGRRRRSPSPAPASPRRARPSRRSRGRRRRSR